jgi:hypothetical protein
VVNSFTCTVRNLGVNGTYSQSGVLVFVGYKPGCVAGYYGRNDNSKNANVLKWNFLYDNLWSMYGKIVIDSAEHFVLA